MTSKTVCTQHYQNTPSNHLGLCQGPQFHHLKKTFEYARLHVRNRSLPQGLGTVTLLATIGNGQIDAMIAGAKL